MMLPEHVNALNKMDREKLKKVKPDFDEQYLAELAIKIAQAKHEEFTVVVQIFNDYEEIKMIGKILFVDLQRRKIKVDDRQGPIWIAIDDILRIEKL